MLGLDRAWSCGSGSPWFLLYLRLGAELHVFHPLAVALELGQRLPLHALVQLHGLLQRLDPPLQVQLVADFTLVLKKEAERLTCCRRTSGLKPLQKDDHLEEKMNPSEASEKNI